MSKENDTVHVNERKFNAVVTLEVSGSKDKDTVKRIARHYFREQYDHSPSKVVVEKKEEYASFHDWEVMVADHSSGSLKDSEEYEV